ncbi:MAG: hypothetical protein WCQ41_01040 [Bacillota bacterium]
MYNWIFEGIGTQIIILILGIVFGVVGDRFVIKIKNNSSQSQKAGKNSIQNMYRGSNVNNNYNEKDEFDISNFCNYNNTEIEAVIQKGNAVTLRKWCLELITNSKEKYLIEMCFKKMSGKDSEIKNLLFDLVDRGYETTDYFQSLFMLLTVDPYKFKLIEKLISLEKENVIRDVIVTISSPVYIFKSLEKIKDFNEQLFNDLLVVSTNLNNTYQNKIKELMGK